MPAVGRIGDIYCGICCCHCPSCCIPMCGVVVTGSSDVITNNRPTARIGDVVLGFCGHVGVICSGSPTVKTNNRATARIGDCAVGCLIVTQVTGSPNVIVG